MAAADDLSLEYCAHFYSCGEIAEGLRAFQRILEPLHRKFFEFLNPVLTLEPSFELLNLSYLLR